MGYRDTGKRSLIKGRKFAMDATTLEANAEMKSIGRRDNEQPAKPVAKIRVRPGLGRRRPVFAVEKLANDVTKLHEFQKIRGLAKIPIGAECFHLITIA